MTKPYPAEAVERLKELCESFMTDRDYGPPMGENEISPRADLAALLSYVEGMKWRHIESAPKDGTPIIVTRCPATTAPPQHMVKWCKGHSRASPQWRIAGTGGRRLRYVPTHWMSPALPPAPDGEG